jgi:hypothetical protein
VLHFELEARRVRGRVLLALPTAGDDADTILQTGSGSGSGSDDVRAAIR